MRNKWLWLALLLFAFNIRQYAQSTFPTNGANNPQVTRYTFINANIQVSPEKFFSRGILEIEDGKIKAVKANGEKYDTTAIVIDLKGKYVYASFIDIYSDYGLPKVEEKKKIKGVRDKSVPPQYESNTKGAFGWNQAIKPETNAAYLFTHNQKAADSLMQMGFGTVASFVHDGIARGTAVLATLNTEAENKNIITEQASANFSFKKGSSKQVYPTSLMGSMALLRQTFYDADAYKNGILEEKNLSLEAFNKQQQLPLIFQADNKWDILRIESIAKEFDRSFIIKTAGDEYQIIDKLKDINAKLIVPLNFPEPIDIKTVFDEANTSYADLRHAAMAAYNPYILNQNNIAFALTASGTKSKEFLKKLKEIHTNGLDKTAILSALTTNPANYINASEKVGTLEKGKLANFIITEYDLFGDNDDIKILENWVQGKNHIINRQREIQIAGNHQLFIGNKKVANITISFKKGELKIDSGSLSNTISKVSYNKEKQQFSFRLKTLAKEYSLTGWNIDWGRNEGVGSDENGEKFIWYSVDELLMEGVIEKPITKVQQMFTGEAKPYSYAKKDSNTFMFRGVTVWTNEKEGVLGNANVLVVNGKVVEVGEVNAETLKKYGIKDSRDIPVINGTGKHLTAGIVDEHSHIAIMGGVNESSESSTAEVRIDDVINPDDINIYRQLAGGVTTSQLLHGSANVIGGQSAVIKLKWGATPNEMKFAGAPGRIKFALGENVKQSNWGEKFTIRFPQTRMGVEQVFEDFFTQAKEYEKAWNDYKNKKTKTPPRKNLELEALLEVVNGERLVSCHSYSQQEINMLMKVAERHGFTINIFTHVLEGYKIADKLKAHGAGASTFSDWWGYKYEVIEASAYNAALLNQAGVTTCINSDDAEMGRRLNQEAAKAIKYGGVSEEDALKMITLNPAKLMGIADKVGSIKVGKDADLVLWSGHPLSVYSKPVTTFIEGVVYFDIREHEKAEAKLLRDKKELIKKMNKEIEEGKEGKEAEKKEEKLYHCDDEEVYGEEANNE
jgi:imidazolonepropionase-like amidohydrolase